MGLDMYLEKRSYQDKEKWEEIVYWRKANQIYNWFLKKNNKAWDEDILLTTDDILNLYEDCVQATLSGDENIFPPKEGFFFGNTIIDEHYWWQIKNTIKQLKPFIDEIKKKQAAGETEALPQFRFMASW